ncbi:MAG: ABC transporter permease subunit [Methylocystaceae bacterium]
MDIVFRLTIKEVISKRLLQLMLLMTVIYLGVLAYGHHMALTSIHVPQNGSFMNEQWFRQQIGYQFLSLGWYIASFIVGAVAVFIGSASISREIESGTILGLASKPISRRAIIGGKFAAYCLICMIYAAVMAAAIMLINHYYFDTYLQIGLVIKSIAIFALLPVVLIAPSILTSTGFSSLASGVTMFFILCVGIVGGFLEQIGALINNPGLVKVGIITSLIDPSDAIYRLAISRVGGPVGTGIINTFGPFGSTSTPSVWMLVYSLLYVIVMVLLAIRVFRGQDF